MKRILFIGASKLSESMLAELIPESQYNIAGILTNKEFFSISYSTNQVRNYNYSDLADFAIKYHIPFYRMQENLQEQNLLNWIETLAFDVILVVGWYHMIPKSWLKKFVCLGLHASMLPAYRGGAPLVWAILNGEKQTGVTLFRLNSQVDAGRILLQESFPIDDDEDIADILVKAEHASKILVRKLLSNWDYMDFAYSEDQVTNEIYPQRSPSDGQIEDFTNAKDVVNFVRAQTRPYPGAFLKVEDATMHIWKCKLFECSPLSTNVGEIFFCEKDLILNCQTGSVLLVDFEIQDISGNSSTKEIFVELWNRARNV